MQVKKFEAPTLQEALEHVKSELGPEAIILQTKKHKKGFGLMSRPSVEITAAVSERSMTKKKVVETRLPAAVREKMSQFSAKRQADVHDKVEEDFIKQATRVQESVKLSKPPTSPRGSLPSSQPAKAEKKPMAHLGSFVQEVSHRLWRGGGATEDALSRPVQGPSKPLTKVRYAEIDDQPTPHGLQGRERITEAREDSVPKTSTVNRDELMSQLEVLKAELDQLKSKSDKQIALNNQAEAGLQSLTSQPGALASPALQEGFERLVLSGVEKRYAYSLCKQVAFELGATGQQDPSAVIDQLAVEMLEQIQVHEPLQSSGLGRSQSGPLLLALVGPTGVGKTTTVAKIASDCILKKGLKVALINFDTYKVGAFDQLATYSKILRVPFRSATAPEDLEAAIQDFQGMDLILVDTAGRSCRDSQSLQEMEKVLHGIPGVHTHLVLSSTTRDSELIEMSQKFSIFRPEGLIFSKLDEASSYGAIYNISMRSKLPLSYFTTGQRVPEDMEAASGERLVSLLLELEP